ncbi:hypothetical protein FJ951_27110 [Mesorhizobium sp. B2-2-3]|uniref:hypothetical protein n=1 Tax=Mesorhizobium sp. B2-2-3 TaxID=2589963 RepID=UPI00112C3133|nr:hypothetical protein [Mesorhizobium sp. B2-2-3]TPM39379.1 hypothetical protein FJ951_27110 [Mesorhizobium sp. B2-2-3]
MYAIGWLQWTEVQALNADVNAIQVGYAGKLDMFETMGFITREKTPDQLPEMKAGMLSRR